MAHRLGFNGYASAEVAPVSTSSVIPSPGESGVYNSYSARVARTRPTVWRDDNGEQRQASVHAPPSASSRDATLPTQPLQGRRAPLWQVALQLRGDELSRLWRRNANHLAGRIFVWSDHSSQWIQLHSPTEAQPGMSPQLFLPPHARDSTRGISTPRALEPVDLTRDARLQQSRLPLRITRGWAVGLAASFLTVVAVAALLPSRTHDVKPTLAPPTVEQMRSTETEPTSPAKPDILKVESLPLVGTQPGRAEPQPNRSKPGFVSDNVRDAAHAPVVSAFNPALARQALARASANASHCSSGEVSGSVQVTYEPSGAVSDVALSALAGDVSGAACIVNSFRAARITPFHGGRVTVKKTFSSHR